MVSSERFTVEEIALSMCFCITPCILTLNSGLILCAGMKKFGRCVSSFRSVIFMYSSTSGWYTLKYSLLNDSDLLV